jgi:hypothetical protein
MTANEMTRAQAERAILHGANPAEFTHHANYHVRLRAWKAAGGEGPLSMDEAKRILPGLCRRFERGFANLGTVFVWATAHREEEMEKARREEKSRREEMKKAAA